LLPLTPHFLGEFLGTTILIVLGGGVCAACNLKRTFAYGAGWIAITTGWGFAVACGIFTAKAFGAPGALNPVGPFSDLLTGTLNPNQAYAMMAGEFLGAFCGAVVVWLHYFPHWAETPDPATKLGVFCTSPAIPNTPANFSSEFIGTFVLVFVASAIGKASIAGIEPTTIGMLVWAIGLSLGGTTGYAINPARDFGPRLAHALLPIAGKGPSNWGYAWIPIIGPFAGAIVATFAFRYFQQAAGLT
jgi:glycerol uptake facilitator protein